MKRIDGLLQAMTKAGASDLHLKAGRPPIVRVDGVLQSLEENPLSREHVEQIQGEMFNAAQMERYRNERELDASYQPDALNDRFRVNCFVRMGLPGIVLRRVPRDVPSIDDLGFKPVLKNLVHNEQGLVLLTGPTGSGKSTTLAAMMRELNETEPLHVITIEDPIEFVHEDRQCLINQREVGIDTGSFAEALRRALRQDPDVILVGEMRDAETIRIATMAAETGHLVLSTLHTNDAKQSVDRIINTFPPEEQLQMRLKLSVTLRGVVSQSLLPRADGEGRVCIQEILVCTPYIRELINKGEVAKIDDAIRDAPSVHEMQSKNQALFDAWNRGVIAESDALATSTQPTDLDLMIRTEKFQKTQRAEPASPAEPSREEEGARASESHAEDGVSPEAPPKAADRPEAETAGRGWFGRRKGSR
jgi:twitching motility protein PilT